jgi:hypothetical protein
MRFLRAWFVVGIAVVAIGCGSTSPATPKPTDQTKTLHIAVDAGFSPVGDGTQCESSFAGRAVTVHDSTGAVVGLRTFPTVATRTGSTKTGIGGINVGECDEATTLSGIKDSPYYTIDLEVGTLDYTREELDAADWSITVSAHTDSMMGEWIVEKG